MMETPTASGSALFKALYKVQPSDFQVDEVLDIELEGSGEHLYLHVEKTACNTDEVASLLEKTCSLTSADIGVSGLKDRHAVTRQWFSVKTPQDVQLIVDAFEAFNTDARVQAESMRLAAVGNDEREGASDASPRQPYCKQLTLIESNRHSRKLRSGAHSANGFVIVLRDIESLSADKTSDFRSLVDERIATLAAQGFPNYIGPQRFGHGGQNLVRARQWFRQPKKRTSRQQRSLWLSAARSALFNYICAARVSQGSWQTLLPGEPAVLDGSRSFFDTMQTSREELQTRLAAFDIHPSAAWWGRGRPLAQADSADFEQQIVSEHADLCAGLERGGLTQERRALRARAIDLQHDWLEDGALELRFRLLPGVFATTLLLELGLCNEPVR